MTFAAFKKPPAKNRKEKRPPKKITATYLHNAGLSYLQKFAASREKFRSILMRKVQKSCRYHKEQDAESCARMVDETVQKFERAGLINDAVYTEGLVTSLRRSGKSRRAIGAKLVAKGVNQDMGTQTLKNIDEREHDDLAAAEFSAARLFAKKKKLNTKEKSKSLAIMGRAGFSYDTARKALEIKDEDCEED